MEEYRKDIKWSPRVSKAKLKSLYESTCEGVWDEQLIDDVGMTLYLRCRDIVNIYQAQSERKLTCPRCLAIGATTLLPREQNEMKQMKCPECGWAMNWFEYRKTFQKRQLNPGGAVKYFKDFLKSYEQAREPKVKMLAIDRVIHEFHFSIWELPDQPCRAAGVNLIEGKLSDVIVFLDKLGNMGLPDSFRAQYNSWRERQDSIKWDEIMERKKKNLKSD